MIIIRKSKEGWGEEDYQMDAARKNKVQSGVEAEKRDVNKWTGEAEGGGEPVGGQARDPSGDTRSNSRHE